MTKKPQPPADNSEAFERSLDTAMNDQTPASDITKGLEVEALGLLDLGFPELSKLLLDTRDEIERLRAEALDAARYRWLAENAVIEANSWRHDGKDPASTKLPLDNAIDAAIAALDSEESR